MRIADLKKLEGFLKCKFDIQKTGSPDWIRAFVVDNRGCSIGRIGFYKEELNSLKCYKRDYIRTLDETDRVFFRLERALHDGVQISDETYKKLILEAKQIRAEDLSAKIAWRKQNPSFDKKGRPKRRPRLTGKNIRFILRNLVMDYQHIN